MYAKTLGATTMGVDGIIIDVELDVSAGLPSFDIVGMANTMVKESKERVRTAIKNSGIKLNADKVMVNLAPAGIRKDSSGLDLPIAIALLAAYNSFPEVNLEKYVFMAELSLDGECRSIPGVLPMVIKAKEIGATAVFVAQENANEACLVDGINVYGIANLAQLVGFLQGTAEMTPAQPEEFAIDTELTNDFCDVQGQFTAKRAFEIAAAGGHNLIMGGSPGSGKTLLAKCLSSILPAMTPEEALEVTKIYSVAGLLKDNSGLITQRPFRSPHHTISSAAMIGGGSIPRPGEVTLSHNGVLFLDELPEFSKATLECLRQPLEDGEVSISRVNATLRFPSRIILIAALNPCPCGYYGDPDKECTCSPMEIKRYNRKISGPLLDRIDIQLHVPRVSYQEITSTTKAENSAHIRARVVKARNIQLQRFRGLNIFCNAQMNHAQIKKFCCLSPEAQTLLEQAFYSKNLSARSYDRIIKVAQTVADLSNSAIIEAQHIAEALQLRNDIFSSFE